MLGFLLAVSGRNGENIDIDHEFHFHNFHVDKNYEIGYTVKMYKFILQSSYFDI